MVGPQQPGSPGGPTGGPPGRRLTRAVDGRPAAPVRIAHLGLGNFFRAHQAWYTEHAADAAGWGIAAFTGRSAAVGTALAGQQGLYTLAARGPDADRYEVVSAVSRVHGSVPAKDWLAVATLAQLSVLTTTITEAGYRRDGTGRPDLTDPQVAQDLVALRSAGLGAQPVTAPGKLVLALAARRAAGLSPVTLVPCDNVPDNAAMLRRILVELADLACGGGGVLQPGLAGWIDSRVGFVTTTVDRITPRPLPQDRAGLLADTGIDDPACVVTEPFSEWVLSGEFVAGRPAWETAGARFVDDVEPWEHRKLWLLNGSHSLMAYTAPLRGEVTVHGAVTDPVVLGWVQQWWDDAARQLPLPADEISTYRAALLERYRNPRIAHQLAQIAADGSAKLPIRVLPVLRAELAAGRVALGATRVLAGWTLHLQGRGAPVTDAAADRLRAAVAGLPADPAVGLVLDHLALPDPRIRAAVVAQLRELAG